MVFRERHPAPAFLQELFLCWQPTGALPGKTKMPPVSVAFLQF
jgi:hypothetical protein